MYWSACSVRPMVTSRHASWSPNRHRSTACAGDAEYAQGHPGSEKCVTAMATFPAGTPLADPVSRIARRHAVTPVTVLPTCLYEPDGDRFVPTGLTRGPWDQRFQHAGPPAALLARAVERTAGVQPGQAARLAFDILRPVPLAPHVVTTRTLRPGRNVEQIEATLADAESGAELMRLNAWRLRTEALELPGGLGEPDPPPGPPSTGGISLPKFWT